MSNATSTNYFITFLQTTDITLVFSKQLLVSKKYNVSSGLD